ARRGGGAGGAARARPGGVALAAGGVPPAADAALPHRRRLRSHHRAARPVQRRAARAAAPRPQAAALPAAGDRIGIEVVMSEHQWVQENLAAYVADGLDTAERERVELHVTTCPGCARALNDARLLDGKLGQLFAPDQPAPALEDALIQRLRQASERRRSIRFSRAARIVAAAAAVALLAMVGAGVSQVLE